MPRKTMIAALGRAVAVRGLVPGTAKPKHGKPGVTLHWLRPEPVTLRAEPHGILVLADFLPFVAPSGRLHRDIKAWLATHAPDALCISRNGHLSLGLTANGDLSGTLARLLDMTAALKAELDNTWTDYARGVFANELV